MNPFLSYFVFLTLHVLISANEIPGRLTIEEAAELQKTCGRKPSSIDVSLSVPDKKSAYSVLTNRTVAPFAVKLDGCSAILISKRHILTAAHCVNNRYRHAHHKHGPTKFAMYCTGGKNCVINNLYEIKIAEMFFSKDFFFVARFNRQVPGDIAVMTLAEDVPISDIIYPACLGGYKLDTNDTLQNFGYGASTPKEKANGTDHSAFLQTFSARKLEGSDLDVMTLVGKEPTPRAHVFAGDSGSGFIHTKNGINNVVGITTGGSPPRSSVIQVSVHLFWIKEVTGIDVKDETDAAYPSYLLVHKDKWSKKTILAGVEHPGKINNYH